MKLSCTFAGTNYWAFPPGHSLADFRNDEAQCHAFRALTIESCLRGRGYRQIDSEAYRRIQKQALDNASRPIDVVAYDISSGEIFIGKSSPAVGTLTAVVEVKSLATNKSCTGYTEVSKLVPGGKGSVGKFELLCRDGRNVIGDFVCDGPRSGYGRGVDSFQRGYLFKFGDLDMDEAALRKAFDEMKRKKEMGSREKSA